MKKVAEIFNLNTQEVQAGSTLLSLFWEFEAILIYLASSRQAKSETLPQKEKKRKKKKEKREGGGRGKEKKNKVKRKKEKEAKNWTSVWI